MLPFVFKTFVLSIFQWPPKTGFIVLLFYITYMSVDKMFFSKVARLVEWSFYHEMASQSQTMSILVTDDLSTKLEIAMQFIFIQDRPVSYSK